jgi:hypothetical protein
MGYIIIIGILMLGIAFGSKFICQNKGEKTETNDKQILIKAPFIENDTIKAMFSKEQINQKLKRLAETPPPKELSHGAMCYSVAMIKNTIHEYVCPICGEKTIYKRNKDEDKFQYLDMILYREIGACRGQVAGVKGINIKLDETEFCSHCMPNTDFPKLYLLLNIAGQSDTTKVQGISATDIQLINEFLNDNLVHKGSQDFETPLVDNIERIKQLLGFK